MTSIDDPQTQPSGRGRIASLLAPGHWAYILLLLVPLGLVDLVCVSTRITGSTEANGTTFGSWSWLAQMSSSVFFYLALITFWIGVFAVIRGRRARRIAVFCFHLTFTFLAFLVILTELYYLLLDVMLNANSFALVKLIFQIEMLKIIEAEVASFVPVLALIGIIVANLFPVIVNRRFKPRWLHQEPTTPPASRRGTVIAVALGLTAALLATSALPNGQGNTNFTRNRVVSIGIDVTKKQLDGPPEGFVQPTRADLPIDTTLAATPRTKKYNVVQIVLESQSWKSTTLGSPQLDTTPNLSKIAKNSLVAERAYTAMPHTTKSLVASNCGVEPPLDTVNSEAEPGGLAAKCLPTLLGEQGYATAFFQSATRNFENRPKVVKAFGYQKFFALESYRKKGFYKTNTLGYEDDIMLEPSLAWAAAHRNRPFSLEYMTLTAHSEYVLPKDWKMKHYVDDKTENNYLNAVRYQDRFVGKVIDGFKRLGLYDNTIFVIMGDHGEGFREHGRRLHNDTIWNEGIQIPYVIHAPHDWTDGARQVAPVTNMSTLQTLADLLGYKIEGGTYRGASIRHPDRAPQPLVTSCWDTDQCVSLIDGNHKYIYFFGYKRPQYYDVVADPHEKHNLFDSLSDAKAQSLEDTALRWQAEVNAKHKLGRRLAR
ncbi:hypothetical protein ASC61_04950 [Aeromicrobium sp. Root344]|uniref:LTA synthase family protein n=1 Tax=Aeromicrobium sp. Root344 TaxID=1736521 RepID=UPI000700393E|nr:LTA synthase family protein [Aeromicrobium sp. Root344]KQV74400.1 hypothetical protein ASC61_04950 [Aeromicrobium sp. Root344]